MSRKIGSWVWVKTNVQRDLGYWWWLRQARVRGIESETVFTGLSLFEQDGTPYAVEPLKKGKGWASADSLHLFVNGLPRKLQYFGHLMWRVDSLEKTDAGRDWGQEEKGTTGWDGWMASLTRWTWVSVNSGSWWWTGRPGVLRFMGSQRVGHDWATDLIWSDLIPRKVLFKGHVIWL